MKLSTQLSSLALLTTTVSAVHAQEPLATRRLGPTVAGSKELLGGVWGVRQLRDGRVLVNDPVKRRLVVFDSALSTMTVLADSTSGGANSHGASAGALIAYGDSTLFVEATALSFLVIGPDGTIGRVMSAPRTSDVNFLVSPSNGVPGIDEKGRLVYRGVARPGPMMFEAGKPMMP